MLPHNYKSCRFVTTDRLTPWYTTMGGIILHANLLLYKLGSISLVVVFYLALQLVACDTGSFQSKLHEHVQSIAPSPVCNAW